MLHVDTPPTNIDPAKDGLMVVHATCNVGPRNDSSVGEHNYVRILLFIHVKTNKHH